MVKSYLQNILRAPKEGYCKICKNYGLLTRDHIPPKGIIEVKPIVISHFFASSGHKNSKIGISGNGLKIRSICAKCNNELLGGCYDPEFIKFANQVLKPFRLSQDHGIVLPKFVEVSLKTQKVTRAIIGHLLAAHAPSTVPIEGAPMYETYRDYFLNKDRDFPESLEIYFWMFPSKSQGIALGYGIADILAKPSNLILGDILKFFPFGFWVIFNKPKEISINQQRLVTNKALGFDSEEKFFVDLSKIPRTDWPENPGDPFAALFNNESTIHTKPKGKKKKKKGKLPFHHGSSFTMK